MRMTAHPSRPAWTLHPLAYAGMGTPGPFLGPADTKRTHRRAETRATTGRMAHANTLDPNGGSI
jgi:hypothetical protein